MHSTALLSTALLAASTFASPLHRRQLGADNVMTEVDVEVVTDIVYMGDNNIPLSTSTCTGSPSPLTTSAAAQTTPATTPAPIVPSTTATPTSIPFPSNGTLNSTFSTLPNSSPLASFSTSYSASVNILASAASGAPPCAAPLTVNADGSPNLINIGGFTLGACTHTATVTNNPLTLIHDSSLLPSANLVSTTAAAGAGEGSTAALPTFSVTSASDAQGYGQADSSTATPTIHALFTTPSAFASQASTLSKITAAPTFGAELTALSVLATESGGLGSAQTTSAVAQTTAAAFAGAAGYGM